MNGWIQTHVGAGASRYIGSPYGQGGYADPYSPGYASGPYGGHHRPWVGLLPSDPGAQWGQAPTAQEKAQGYKKTDVMTLSLNVSALRTKVDDLMSQVDPSTDAASLALLKKLQDDVTALDSAVAYLYSSGPTPTNSYPLDLIRYQGLLATWNSFGIEQVTEPAPAPTAHNPAPQPTTATEQHAATPSSPVIVKKADSSWGYYVAGGLALIGLVLVGAGVLK